MAQVIVNHRYPGTSFDHIAPRQYAKKMCATASEKKRQDILKSAPVHLHGLITKHFDIAIERRGKKHKRSG